MNPWGLMSLDIFTGDSPTVAAYRVKKAKIEAERSRLILSKAKSIQASTHESLQKKASIMRGSSRHLSVHNKSHNAEPTSPRINRENSTNSLQKVEGQEAPKQSKKTNDQIEKNPLKNLAKHAELK